MRWPWQREIETRADSSYTDALVAAITANAGGRSIAFPTATAALETCAGFIGRAFAAAEVRSRSGLADALDPVTMAMIGRALIRRGEIVFLIRADMERGVYLLPCASHDVDGGPDPATWVYRCTVGGPDRTFTYSEIPASGVLHLSYGRDPERPWRGYGPLYTASLAGRLSASTAKALADEAGGPVGSLLGVPVDGDDDTVRSLKADLGNMAGKLSLLQSGDWDREGGGATSSLEQKRIGPDPPSALVELMRLATEEIMAACGLNPAIFQTGTGTAGREAYRQALFGTIAPLGRQVETELRRKLEDDAIALTWNELRASDISGRARAFQSLVGGGMELDRAAALSGLMVPDGDAR